MSKPNVEFDVEKYDYQKQQKIAMLKVLYANGHINRNVLDFFTARAGRDFLEEFPATTRQDFEMNFPDYPMPAVGKSGKKIKSPQSFQDGYAEGIADAKQAYELKVQDLANETLKTSELTKLVQEQYDRLEARGCVPKDWSKADDDCRWMAKAKENL